MRMLVTLEFDHAGDETRTRQVLIRGVYPL
jgi:hypothetical protein